MLKSTCAAGAGFNAAPVVIKRAENRRVEVRAPFDAALPLLGGGAWRGDIDVERYLRLGWALAAAAAAAAVAMLSSSAVDVAVVAAAAMVVVVVDGGWKGY